MLHDDTHFARDTLTTLVSQLFVTRGLHKTIKKVTQVCVLCSKNNPQSHLPPSPLLMPIQHWVTYPWEDWKIDFTQMPSGFKYLLVLVDTSLDGLKPFLSEQKELLMWPSTY